MLAGLVLYIVGRILIRQSGKMSWDGGAAAREGSEGNYSTSTSREGRGEWEGGVDTEASDRVVLCEARRSRPPIMSLRHTI